MPTKVANPRKGFNFKVEIGGIDQFEIQNVKLPEPEIEVVEHGDTNRKVGTGGLVKYSDLVLTRIVPVTNSDVWAWVWLGAVQNPATGGGALPSVYTQDLVLKEMDTTGLVTVNRWIIECWPKKIKQSDFSRVKSENVMEEVTLHVNLAQKF